MTQGDAIGARAIADARPAAAGWPGGWGGPWHAGVRPGQQARVDHAVDWAAYLAGQSIVASTWSVMPDEDGGIAIEAAAFEAQRTSVRVGGGRVGGLYRVTNRVTLSDGQIDERTITFRVEER